MGSIQCLFYDLVIGRSLHFSNIDRGKGCINQQDSAVHTMMRFKQLQSPWICIFSNLNPQQTFFFSWEKKTDFKVHYENSWSRKGSEKQNYSSWNLEKRSWNQIGFCYSEKGFFQKKADKKSSANLGINSRQKFVISTFKTEITKWSQIWCQCLTFKTHHGAAFVRKLAQCGPI